MDIRALPAGQGLAWFKQAIDLGARNPRAVFGAALLLVLSLYATALLAVLLASALAGDPPASGAPPQLRQVAMVALPLFLMVMLLVPILLGGLMHVIRETEAGRPVRPHDLFAPLRAASGRRLALLGLLQIGLALLGGMLMVAVAGGDYWRDYMTAMQGAMSGSVPVMPQPDNAGVLFLVQLAFNYFSYAVMLFSIPLMLFSGSGIAQAVKDSLRASVRNVAPNLLAGALFIGALLVATLIVMLVVTLLAMVGNAIHPVLGVALPAAVMLCYASVVLVLVTGGAFLAWRDTFGDGATPPPVPPVHGLEA